MRLGPVLGLSVASRALRAVWIERGTIRWTGSSSYEGPQDLAEAIAQLAGEAGTAVRRVRVVLERDVLQLRTIVPAPPLKPAAVRRWVALEAARLFRKNGAALVTDATLVRRDQDTQALWAAAVAEPLVRAVLAGCAQAGLALESLGPAAEVLPRAYDGSLDEALVLENGGTIECVEVGPSGVWRSRLVRSAAQAAARPLLTRALAALGDDAPHFAAAYGAAVALRSPSLALLPPEDRAARERTSRRRLLRLAGIAAVLWALAGVTYVARLSLTIRHSTLSLDAFSTSVDSALTARRELGMARATLATIAQAQAARSRHLALLGDLTKALGDSTHLVALRIAPDGTVRLAGFAPVAARVVANLERVEGLSDIKLEGPVTREQGAGSRQQDRFAIVARLERAP